MRETNRKIFPLDAVPMSEAWELYEETLSDHLVVFADEPTDWKQLGGLSRSDSRSPPMSGPTPIWPPSLALPALN